MSLSDVHTSDLVRAAERVLATSSPAGIVSDCVTTPLDYYVLRQWSKGEVLSSLSADEACLFALLVFWFETDGDETKEVW
jgi:hypothetical protein